MQLRVGVAGFLHESNTFLPTPTCREHFEQASFTIGRAMLDRWTGSHHELGGIIDGLRQADVEIVPLVATYAVPSGTIETAAFEWIAGELIGRLDDRLDGLVIALHGATVAAAFPDADGEILRRLRARLGPEFPIVATLDLHANISAQMAENADAIVVYRSNPHLDQHARGREAALLMLRRLRGEIRPVLALEAPPLVIPIAAQHTAVAPARQLYEDVETVLSWPGILAASAAMGFYYADVAENGASFLAVADGDEALARRAARWMAARAWERRREFLTDLPDAAQAVAQAAKAAAEPVVLLDIGDNVGGGSPADSTILLEEIMRQGVPNALVILYDPQAVEECVAAGVRNRVRLRVGGKTDRLHGDPVEIEGTVRLISDGRFVETQVRHGGWGMNDQGVTAVVETGESHTIVLTSFRMAPMSLEQILSLGIKPERKKILVVKGVVAPRAAYAPVAGSMIAVDTPGATAADPARFVYRHRRRPLYPLEKDAAYEVAAAV
jgi:microcystin degradation protein MlrC